MIVAIMASATFWTLFTRSTVGGVALNIGVQSFISFTVPWANLADWLRARGYLRREITSLFQPSFFLCYAGVMVWLGGRTLARFQATGGMGSDDLLMAGPDVMSGALAGGCAAVPPERAHDGQVILGQMREVWRQAGPRLPHAADLFPEIADPSLDSADDGPSCSMAEALEKQSLTVNEMAANIAWNLLWRFLRYGELTYHGAFFNLETGRTNPMSVDPEVWASMGYQVEKPEMEDSEETEEAVEV